MLKIQSVSDVITNSSSELFVVEKSLMIDVVDLFDDKFMQCFNIEKITYKFLYLNNIKFNNYFFPYELWDKSIYDIHIFNLLDMLNIPYEDAAKEGYPIKYDNKEGFWDVLDFDRKLKRGTKKYRDEVEKFHIKYFNFCKNHIDEIEKKLIGKYYMVVDDHFNDYSEFKDYMNKRRKEIIYYESRH